MYLKKILSRLAMIPALVCGSTLASSVFANPIPQDMPQFVVDFENYIAETVAPAVPGAALVVIANGVKEPWHAITLGQQVLTVINERLPIQGIQLRPSASIGIAMYYGDLTAEQLYRRAFSAAFTARRKGKNQIQFFDPEQMEKAQQRLTEESDILTALDNRQFAIWLQPQVNLLTGEVKSAEALLRVQQPDGSWELPEGLIERIESCGLMVTVTIASIITSRAGRAATTASTCASPR